MTTRTALVPADPVCWQWRRKDGPDVWTTMVGPGSLRFSDPEQFESRPLYAASPRAGRVGLDVLEMAARAIDPEGWSLDPNSSISQIVMRAHFSRQRSTRQARAAFEAAGLAVEEAAS